MIDILMATYNGASYIEQQLQSIQRQTRGDWRLWIHDDGSDDDTVAIVDRWCAKDRRIVRIQDEVHHWGAARNFMSLTRYATGDYMMFSDQDDVWDEDKIEKMMAVMEGLDDATPQVVYANAVLWKQSTGELRGMATLTFPTSVRQLLFLNTGIQGASALWNKAMNALLQEDWGTYAMHDHALTLLGVTMGEVHYLNEALMKYRIHETNVTGDAAGDMWHKVLGMWKNRHEPIVERKHYEAVAAFYKRWGEQLREEDRKLIVDFLAMPEWSWGRKMGCVIKDKWKLFDSTLLLMVKMSLRPYIAYKKKLSE